MIEWKAWMVMAVCSMQLAACSLQVAARSMLDACCDVVSFVTVGDISRQIFLAGRSFPAILFSR